jgi:hypothetical protein
MGLRTTDARDLRRRKRDVTPHGVAQNPGLSKGPLSPRAVGPVRGVQSKLCEALRSTLRAAHTARHCAARRRRPPSPSRVADAGS